MEDPELSDQAVERLEELGQRHRIKNRTDLISTRVPPSLVEKIDFIRQKGWECNKLRLTRSNVMLMLIEKGLEQMERERHSEG